MYEIIRIISSRCKQPAALHCCDWSVGSTILAVPTSKRPCPPLHSRRLHQYYISSCSSFIYSALVLRYSSSRFGVYTYMYIHTRVHSIRPCTTYGGVPQAILYITAGTHPHAALLLFSLCCLLARPPSLNYLLHPSSSACAAAPKNSTFKSTDGSDCCCPCSARRQG